jgi:hypothetical protein
MGKFVDLTGKKQVNGRLTAIERIGTNKSGGAIWLCNCECGNMVEISGDNFRRGTTRSCGCLRNERVASACHKHNRYELLDGYGVGYFSNTENRFLFSLQDYDIIKEYCWYEDSEGYARAWDKQTRKHISMHELLLGKWCDHRNRNKWDNRRENVVRCTQQENNINRSMSTSNTSSYMGVSFNKRAGKYHAYIGLPGGRKHLGFFTNKDDAIVARLKAEAEYWGEIAPQRHLFDKYGIIVSNEVSSLS